MKNAFIVITATLLISAASLYAEMDGMGSGMGGGMPGGMGGAGAGAAPSRGPAASAGPKVEEVD